MTTSRRGDRRTLTWLADRVSPSKAELEAARGRTIPDVLGPDLDVVFVGINPGLWSGAVGHHFARPGQPLLEGAPRFGVHRPAPVPARGRVAARTEPRPDEPRRSNHRDRRRARRRRDPRRSAGTRGSARAAASAVRRRARDRRVPDGVRSTRRGARAAGRGSRRRAALGPAEPERPERALPAGRTHPALPSTPRRCRSVVRLTPRRHVRARHAPRRAPPPRSGPSLGRRHASSGSGRRSRRRARSSRRCRTARSLHQVVEALVPDGVPRTSTSPPGSEREVVAGRKRFGHPAGTARPASSAAERRPGSSQRRGEPFEVLRRHARSRCP